jgi:hypothetical protein
MIYNVLLISEQKLKDNAPIDANVDSSELRYGIQQAQIIFTQETLGTNLYEKILRLVRDNEIDLPQNVNYKELLNNYIVPALIAFSYYLILDNMFIKIVNVGLQQYRSEQSNPIGIKEFQYLKSQAKDRAEFLDNLMRRHLVFNNAKYPEYAVIDNLGQLVPEFTGAFKAPITLPSRQYIFGSWGNNGYGSDILGCGIPWWYGGRGSGE